jgi:xylan 1,4-beta-xylosidase
VLVWRHVDDQHAAQEPDTEVTVRVEHLPFESPRVRVRHWRVDGLHSNSHTAWIWQGSPQDPTEPQLRAIKERQGLELLEPDREEPLEDAMLELRFRLPLPAVSLLEITPWS